MAIAHDASATAGNGGGPRTAAITCSGSATLGIAIVFSDNGDTDTLTGLNWNGVAMTFLGKVQQTNVPVFWTWVYGILNPTTGNVVTTGLVSGTLDVISYTGTETTLPTNVVTNIVTTSQTSITTTINVSSSTSWVVGQAKENTNGGDSWSGIVSITNGFDHGGAYSGDSNGTVASGNQTATLSGAAGSRWAMILTEIKAPAAGPTGVKTWDGVTQSTGIKTYMGVALASTKSVIGVT